MKTNLNTTFVLAASLALSACASLASQVEFKGLNNQTLGNASVLVDPAGGGLTISGIGTNGTDGVSVATGGDGGGTFDLGKFNPAALPVNAWLRWRAVDTSDNELQKLTIQATASGGAFFADFTGLGAPTVSVALYSNDVLVATATGIDPTTPVATFGSGTSGGGLPLILNPCILHPEACYGVIDVIVWQPDPAGSTGSLLSLPGQGPMLCTRLEISPGYNIPYFVPKYRVKATEITGNNLGTQNIANEGLVYFGLEHHALGQAQYNFDVSGALTVTNIGIGGADGVEIALQNANTFGADMVALNPQPFPPAPGSPILTINATGNFVGGSGEQALGDLRVMQLTDGTQPLQLRADLPTGSSGPLAVELWQGGTLLTTYFADPAGPAFNFGQGFSGVYVGDPDEGPWCGTRPPGPPRPPWWWSLRWAMPTQVSLPGGGNFLVDHVLLSPSASGSGLKALTRVSFQAVGPQPLVFTGERSQRNGLTFEGSQHFALGNAILNTANGQLLVDNFGMAAGDGVEVLLGRANGCEVASPSLPLPPPGSAQTYSLFADVDGIPDRPAGTLTTQMNPDGNLQVIGDYSAVGATHFTVAVLNGDALVARQTGLPSPAFTIQTSNSAGGLTMAMKWSPNGNGGYMNAVKWAGDDDIPIGQPFSPPVHGTRVVVIPEDPSHQLGPLSRLRVTASGPTPWPWAIATEKLNLFGHGHTGLGSTYMTADTGLLSLANLGPGGTNGVSIDVGNSRSASVTLALDPSIVQGPQPLPWFLQTTAFGEIGGQPNQTFGSQSFLAATGGVIQVSADFSPVGSTSQTIEVWSLGQMVQRIVGHTGPVCTVSAPPVVLGVQDGSTFLTHFGQPAFITIDGGPALQGDTLLVRPGTETPSVSAWQKVNLQAGGMDSFGISYESDTAALTPAIAGISPAPGGGFQISVPTVFGYLYTLEATKALGPQPVPWTPVQTFLGDGTTRAITLSNPAYVSGSQGYFRVRLGNNSSGSPTGGPVPDMFFPKHVFLDLLDVTVDETHDASGGDRPYFATILFQTQGSTDGSTVVNVVDQPPHDWVAQAGIDHMHAGDSLAIPSWMGAMEWNDLQWHTIPDLIQNSIAHPPIMVMGALVIAVDNRNTPPGAIHDLLTQLATALQQQLVTDVESGNLFTGITWLNQALAAQQLNTRATALANAAIAKVQPDLIGLLISSLGDPDIPIGVNLLLMPAVPGLGTMSASGTVSIPSFCNLSVKLLERSPDNFSTTMLFRGCNASYRVNARIRPDFVPPTPPPNQPDPTLVEIIGVQTKTGDDDLRSDSTAQATIKIKNRSPVVFNLNDPNQGFSPGSSHSKTILLSPPAPYLDIESITLHVVQGGGISDDNWDVDGLTVGCNGPILGIHPLLSAAPPLGNPHIVRLVAKDVHPEKNEFVTKEFPFTH